MERLPEPFQDHSGLCLVRTARRSRSGEQRSRSDRDDFGGNLLTGLTAQNVELRDNYSPDAWYSLNETSGALVLQLTNLAARPLNAGAPAFPLITRALPAATDFFLQTNLSYVTPQIASFVSGLYIETVEGGVTMRYAFGLDGGTTLKVWQSVGGAAYTNPHTPTTYAGGDVTLRVQRVGASLLFQQRVNRTGDGTLEGRQLRPRKR